MVILLYFVDVSLINFLIISYYSLVMQVSFDSKNSNMILIDFYKKAPGGQVK